MLTEVQRILGSVNKFTSSFDYRYSRIEQTWTMDLLKTICYAFEINAEN